MSAPITCFLLSLALAFLARLWARQLNTLQRTEEAIGATNALSGVIRGILAWWNAMVSIYAITAIVGFCFSAMLFVSPEVAGAGPSPRAREIFGNWCLFGWMFFHSGRAVWQYLRLIRAERTEEELLHRSLLADLVMKVACVIVMDFLAHLLLVIIASFLLIAY